MKAIGIILLGIAIGMLLSTVIQTSYAPSVISPIPDTKGVKVIFVNPTGSLK